MKRRIFGILLLIAGLALGVVLFLNGRLVFPHIIGPGTLLIIGAALLSVRAKTNKSVQ